MTELTVREWRGPRLAAVVAAAALLFGLFTTFQLVNARGRAYFSRDGSQQRFDRAVLEGHGGSPFQYRLLAPHVAAVAIRGAEALGIEHPVFTSYVALRVLDDALMFVLAFLYYRALGLSTSYALIGMSLLAWGMSYAHFNSSLHLDTVLGVSFYLLAALSILRRHYALGAPIALVAALNRESSGLIPFMFLADFVRRGWSKPRLGVTRVEGTRVAAPFAVYAGVFVALRLAYGEQPMHVPFGHAPGLDLLQYNVLNVMSWVELFATLGLVPLLALAGYRLWPAELRAFACAIVPVWVLVHLFAAVIAEARLFLVPEALVFVPGALFFARGDAAPRAPAS